MREILVDAVVVGAGPAGLAAASALLANDRTIALLEQGAALEDRNEQNPADLVSGVGGTGLMSDGKFSFFPSASGLWELKPKSSLFASYEWFLDLLRDHGRSDIVELNSELFTKRPTQHLDRLPIVKRYPSYYVSLDDRQRIVRSLAARVEPPLFQQTTVRDITFANSRCAVTALGPRNEPWVIRARAAIWGTGRFGPVLLHKALSPSELAPRRLEVGIRIQQPADDFFLRDEQDLDPKILLPPHNGVAVRTFCCCRQGKIVVTRMGDIRTVSGRADCPPTGFSSIGLIARLSTDQARERWVLTLAALESTLPFSMPLSEFRIGSSPLLSYLGPAAHAALVDAINRLIDDLGYQIDEDAEVHGPAIEGVFEYPHIDNSLRLVGRPFWVAGDCTGLFRGITAAFVSGYFCGLEASRELDS